VYWLVEHVRATGRTAIVPPLVWPALSRVSGDRVGTARHRRIAALLALPLLALAGGRPHWWSTQVGQGARAGIWVLAAAGPLTLGEVSAAVVRSRRYYTDAVPHLLLVAGLGHLGAHIDQATGRWSADPPAKSRIAALLAAAATSGRAVYTRRQIRDLLVEVGDPSTSSRPRRSTFTRCWSGSARIGIGCSG